MVLDLLIAAQPLAFEILERTASTPRVQQIVQLSLAPAFLLAGIGAVMNVMVSRLIWIGGRIDTIDERADDSPRKNDITERLWLMKRRQLAQTAVMCGTGAAVLISMVIAMLFISAWIEAQIGTVIAVAWIATMLLLIVGLMFFFREAMLAARGVGSRRNKRGER